MLRLAGLAGGEAFRSKPQPTGQLALFQHSVECKIQPLCPQTSKQEVWLTVISSSPHISRITHTILLRAICRLVARVQAVPAVEDEHSE